MSDAHGMRMIRIPAGWISGMGNGVPETVHQFLNEHATFIAATLSGQADPGLVLDHGLDPPSGRMGG